MEEDFGIKFDVRQTEEFENWLLELKDIQGRGRMQARIRRLSQGNPGDVKAVGEGVSELKLGGKGPGYRLYFAQHGETLVMLLVGGDKSSQKKDIKRAKELAKDWREGLKR
jgi:putative addiction module killer protein